MHKLDDRFLKLIERLPAFPQSVSRVLEMTSNIDCSPKELVKVIEHDPVMTVKILKLVNSAYFSPAREIASINQALVIIGINTVKNLAISVAALGAMPKTDCGGIRLNAFLDHSISVAVAAKNIAKWIGVPARDANDFFIAGLLHDFGRIVLARYLSKESEQAQIYSQEHGVSLLLAEQRSAGADHTQLGTLLAATWKLPLGLREAIQYHHDPDSPVENHRMRDIVLAANEIAIGLFSPLEAGIGIGPELPEPVAQRLGASKEELIMALGNLRSEVDQSRIFMQL